MKTKLVLLTILLAVSVTMLFCGGGGEKPEKGDKPVETSGDKPDWLGASGMQGKDIVYVGVEEGENEAEVKEGAANKGLAGLAKICEADVNAMMEKQTTTEEKDGIEERSSQMESVINVETKAVLKGVMPDKVYWEKYADNTYKYYVLMKISKKNLDKVMYAAERALAAVDELIAEAKNLCDQGRIGEGIVKYAEAARNALILKKNVTRFPKIMSEITNVLKSVKWNLDPASNNQKGSLKNGLPKPIMVSLTYKTIEVIDTPIKLYLYEQRGSLYDKTGVTDSEGKVEFKVQRITVPGERKKARVSLDVKDAVEQLRRIKTPAYRAAATTLQENLDKNGVQVVYAADSKERKLPSALITIDVMHGGNINIGGRSDSVLRTALKNNGFNLKTISTVDAKRLVNKNDSERVKYLKSFSDIKRKGIKRVFLAVFTGSEPKNNRVKVVGELFYFNLESGSLENSVVKNRKKSGSNPRDAYNNSAADVVKKIEKEIKKGMF